MARFKPLSRCCLLVSRRCLSTPTPASAVPEINASEYLKRQQLFCQSILPPESICIIPGHSVTYSHDNIFHPFFPYPNTRYFSGWAEPDSVLVLHNLPALPTESLDQNLKKAYSSLFIQVQSEEEVLWDGKRAGLPEAGKVTSSPSLPLSALPNQLRAWSKRAKHIFIDTDIHLPMLTSPGAILPETPPLIKVLAKSFQRIHFPKMLEGSGNPSLQACSIQDIKALGSLGQSMEWISSAIQNLRVVKSPTELAVMRRVGQMSGRAVNETIRASKACDNEHKVHAMMEYYTKMQGCDALGYVPVVAAGTNALTIHHTRNRSHIKSNDLILMDAAGILDGYHADITRTWPICGRFSIAQKAIYELVLGVQKELIKQCAVDPETRIFPSLNQLQRMAYFSLWSGMQTLLSRQVSRTEMDMFYPHHVSHYIGLSLHDTPSVSKDEPLRPGMTLTIEPGLYIPDHAEYGEFRGIGVRIEDVIAVQSDGLPPLNLTVEAVKEIVDIEALMGMGGWDGGWDG